MLAHMLHERRTPGRQRHRVNQCQAAVILAIEQVRAQCCGAAEVVGHHVGAIQAPMLQKLRQQLVLHTERDIVVGLRRLPIAQQIEVVDAVSRHEIRRDPVPHERRKGRAMHEHQRRAVAAHGVAHLMSVEVEDLIQWPVSHGLVLLAGEEAKSIGIKKQPMKAVFHVTDETLFPCGSEPTREEGVSVTVHVV
ncbi:hypothetical protein D3C84_855410 [compost metagenome]